MSALLELKHITKNFSRPLDLAAKIARYTPNIARNASRPSVVSIRSSSAARA